MHRDPACPPRSQSTSPRGEPAGDLLGFPQCAMHLCVHVCLLARVCTCVCWHVCMLACVEVPACGACTCVSSHAVLSQDFFFLSQSVPVMALSPGDCASCPSLSCCLCRGAHLSLFPELGIEMRTLGTPGALVQGHGLPEGPRPPHQPSPHPDCVLGTLWASGSCPTACTGESERWVETSHL